MWISKFHCGIHINFLRSVIISLLQEIKDVIPKEIPNGLPLMKEIEHQIFPNDTIWEDLNTNGFVANQRGSEKFTINGLEIFFVLCPVFRWKDIGV